MFWDETPAFPMSSWQKLRFSGRLDLDLLRESLAAAALRHPLMTARVALVRGKPYWELRDKEPEKLTAMLREAVGGIPVFVPEIKDNPRAATREELAALFGPQARAAQSLEEAIASAAEAAGNAPVLICGSLYLLGDVFSLWPELLLPQNS